MPEVLERGGATVPEALERGGATVCEPHPGLGNDVRFRMSLGLGTPKDSVRMMPLGPQTIAGDRVMGLLWFAWLTKQDKVKIVYRCYLQWWPKLLEH